MRSLWIAFAFAVLAAGCIGAESSEPPVVGIRNMYNQPRYDTQERQPFFADQRSMRPQVEGTVSREMSKGFDCRNRTFRAGQQVDRESSSRRDRGLWKS